MSTTQCSIFSEGGCAKLSFVYEADCMDKLRRPMILLSNEESSAPSIVIVALHNGDVNHAFFCYQSSMYHITRQLALSITLSRNHESTISNKLFLLLSASMNLHGSCIQVNEEIGKYWDA